MSGPRSRMAAALAAAVVTAAVTLATAGAPRPALRPESIAGTGGNRPARGIAAIEFHEWPPSELSVSGGFLGVPDSAGRFPESFRRYDPGSGHTAASGSGAGNLLVFTDLQPGTYRVALILLDPSRTMERLLSLRGVKSTADRCLVYGDTASALTFAVGGGEFRFLGRVTRTTRPALDSTEVWRSTIEWSPGDEPRAVKTLLRRKEFAPWRDLLVARAAALDSISSSRRRDRR